VRLDRRLVLVSDRVLVLNPEWRVHIWFGRHCRGTGWEGGQDEGEGEKGIGIFAIELAMNDDR